MKRKKIQLTVINEEDPAIGVYALLPAFGQRSKLVDIATWRRGRHVVPGYRARSARAWVHPRRGAFVVIDEEHATVRRELHTPARWQAFAV